jgi:hypothetical protein
MTRINIHNTHGLKFGILTLMPKYCDPSSFQLHRKKKRKGPLHLTLVSCDEQTLPILDKKKQKLPSPPTYQEQSQMQGHGKIPNM